ncbi:MULTISPECIES: hypothetical protein [unclassified Luteococcus]|uniref:hypothetical protein n=1 Tax=unclassified Luteococcus TaxID=2639923 RepID=UPI00313E9F50
MSPQQPQTIRTRRSLGPGRSVRTALAIAVLGLGLGLSACGSDEEPTPPDPSSAVATSLPGLATPTGDPTLASMEGLAPKPGSVVQAKGPFDNRFTLSKLKLADGNLTGAVTVTSDVSELLELQVLAGFHDADGKLLGTARFTHHLDGAHDHAAEEHDHAASGPATPNYFHTTDFTIAVPKELADKAVSASVGVPVLVNE